jgi:hypothetical protein
VEGPWVILLSEQNDFVLGDKIGASLAPIANFGVFKIQAGHRSILYLLNDRDDKGKDG